MAPAVYISAISHHFLFVHLPTIDVFQSEVKAARQIDWIDIMGFFF